MAYLARDNNINRYLEILSLEKEKGNADLYFANFSRCSLPKDTRRVVEAISTSQHVDSGLVLLGWLASVAGLDRGCHRVIHKARGHINSLSLLIMGGAESGSGKSSALKPFIECISQIESGCKSDKNSSDYDDEVCAAYMQRIKYIRDEYAKKGDVSKLDEIEIMVQMLRKMEAKKSKYKFLMSDITKSAYSKLMVDQGFVMRMESDGILLPSDTFNMIRKFWGGETHSEGRISRGQTTCKDPFIVDLVFTQIEPFTKFIKNKVYIETGLCARMLIYRAAKIDPRNYSTPQHELDPDIKEFIRKVFARINECATSDVGHKQITLTVEAERAWSDFQMECSEKASRENAEIKEWAKRMAQHALRIAGILHIAECPEPEKVPVSWDEVETAIQITKVLADNLWECMSGHASRQEQACMCDVGIHVLKENMRIFNATQLRQRFKDRYSSAEVNTALYKLEQRGIIRDISEAHFGKRGRPSGHEYWNALYESELD